MVVAGSACLGSKQGASGCWVLEMRCWWVVGARNGVFVVPVARNKVLVGAGCSKRGVGGARVETDSW